MQSQDPWNILYNSLAEFRKELQSFYNIYTDAMRQIWVKLTALEVSFESEIKRAGMTREAVRWLIPVLISIIGMLLYYKYGTNCPSITGK